MSVDAEGNVQPPDSFITNPTPPPEDAQEESEGVTLDGEEVESEPEEEVDSEAVEEASEELVEEVPKSVFDEFFSDKSTDDTDDLKDLIKEGDPEGYSSRVKALVAERKATEQQLVEAKKQFEQYQANTTNYYNQLQQQLQGLKEDNIKYKTMLETNKPKQNTYREPSSVDELVQQVTERVLGEQRQAVDPIKQELDTYKKQMEKAQYEAEIKQRQEHYRREAESAVNNILLSKVDQEFASTLSPKLIELALANAYTHACSLEEAASDVQRTMMEFALAYERGASKKTGSKKVKAAQSMPKVASNRKPATSKSQDKLKPIKEAQARGLFDWMKTSK
jgi:hypothetical protein